MLIIQFGLEVTDRQTDRQTDIATYRAAIAAKKLSQHQRSELKEI